MDKNYICLIMMLIIYLIISLTYMMVRIALLGNPYEYIPLAITTNAILYILGYLLMEAIGDLMS